MDFFKELLDYTNHGGRFEDKEGFYVGMGGSEYPETIIIFFKSLSEKDRNEFIRILIDASIGKIDKLLEKVSSIYSLLFVIIVHGYGKYIEKYLKVLEDEFNREENIIFMLNAEDNDSLLSGKDFKMDWHYGLILSLCIGRFRFKNIEKTYNRLIKEAVSFHFRETLIRNGDEYFFKGKLKEGGFEEIEGK